MRAVAVVGEYCMATSWCLAVWSAHGWMLAQMPIEGQKKSGRIRRICERSIVPKTVRQEGDDVIVSGRFGLVLVAITHPS